jgi:hypothetical protein
MVLEDHETLTDPAFRVLYEAAGVCAQSWWPASPPSLFLYSYIDIRL